MNQNIDVLDSIPGSGKSTALLNWMNDNPQNLYLYVTPLLSEVDRVLQACTSIEMCTPSISENSKTKAQDLLYRLEMHQNLVITHAMYEELSKDHLYYLNAYGYTIIIDEEVGFVNALSGYTYDDIKSLFAKDLIEADYENFGKVTFKWSIGQTHKYFRLKNLCEIGSVYSSKNQQDVFVTQLPLGLITSAKRVIVSTYGYYGSAMHKFMQMQGIQHKDFTEVSLKYTEKDIKSKIKDLIEFVETPSTKNVEHFGMSHSWWSSSGNTALKNKKKVFSAIRSVKRALNKSDDDFMYTTKKSASENTGIRGYYLKHDKSFVYVNCRATNDFAHKTLLVHAYNRYANVQVQKYMASYGFDFSDDHYALHELLQWIWRSAIRNEQKIQVCIIPKRMRGIFKVWLMDFSEQS